MMRLTRLVRISVPILSIVVLAGCAASTGSRGDTLRTGSRGDAAHAGPLRHGRGGRPPAAPAFPSVDEIIEELVLSDDQVPEVRGVLEASEDERAEMMARHAGSRGPGAFEEVREELDGLRARTEIMLAPLLTDEQMGRYRRIVERAEAEREWIADDMKARRPEGPGAARGRPPGF
jgi:hypothetical protein